MRNIEKCKVLKVEIHYWLYNNKKNLNIELTELGSVNPITTIPRCLREYITVVSVPKHVVTSDNFLPKYIF